MFRAGCDKLFEYPGGAVAQLGARLDGIEEVVGSNPIGSTNFVPSFQSDSKNVKGQRRKHGSPHKLLEPIRKPPQGIVLAVRHP
jgi:hypothetical protein